MLRLGGENKKGGDGEAGENVRRESEREERALAGKNKEKETKESGKRERETREKEEEKQRKEVEKREREKREREEEKRKEEVERREREKREMEEERELRPQHDDLLGLDLWDWPITDPAAESPLAPDLVQYGSQGQIIEVS